MQQAKTTAEPKSGFFYGYIVVIAIFFTMVLAFGTNFAFGVFFVPVKTSFGWTSAMTAGAFSLSMLMQGIVGVLMGGLTDRFGPRVIMTFSGILLGIGYWLMSMVGNLWQLYLYYGVIIGVGMSSGYVTLLSTIARWFNIRRNLMTGIVLIGMSIGTLVAPPVSERLISAYDWQTSYIITAVAVFVVVVLAAQFMKRDPSTVGQVPDGRQGKTAATTDINSKGFTLKQAAGKKQFWLFIGAEFCFGFILFSIMVNIAPHASSLGVSDAHASLVLAALGGSGILGRVILGNAADRLGNKKVFMLGFILLAIALLWLAPAKAEWMLYVFSAVFGFAFAGMETSESPMTAWLFGLKSHGMVFGTISLFFTIGASVGPLVTAYIFDVTGKYQLAFIILAAVGIIGLIFTLFLRSLVSPEKPLPTNSQNVHLNVYP
jgi:MFS family permease